MGMMIFRPGQRLVIPGVQVYQPRGSSASTWWDNNGAIGGCVAAYAAKGAADLASSYVNLANPGTYTAAPGVAPTWDATGGWTFNGTSRYLTTGIVPVIQTWSMIVRFSDIPASTQVMIGAAQSGSCDFSIYPKYAGTTMYFVSGSSAALASTGLSAATVAIGGNIGYVNGSPVAGTIPAGSGTLARGIYIGALNNGTATLFFNGKIQALAIYSTTLSAGEVATITTAINLI